MFFQKLNHRLTMRQRRKSVLTFIEEWWQFSCDTTDWGISDNPLGFKHTWTGRAIYPLLLVITLYLLLHRQQRMLIKDVFTFLLKCYSSYKWGTIKLLCSLNWVQALLEMVDSILLAKVHFQNRRENSAQSSFGKLSLTMVFSTIESSFELARHNIYITNSKLF